MLVFFVLLTGCSKPKSIVNDAEAMFRQVIQNESEGNIFLVQFEKKNGREIDKSTYELV